MSKKDSLTFKVKESLIAGTVLGASALAAGCPAADSPDPECGEEAICNPVPGDTGSTVQDTGGDTAESGDVTDDTSADGGDAG